MDKRVEGYDFIRSLAILIVFLGHIINEQSTNSITQLVIGTLTPGLTMSLLGFISASLLSGRDYDPGSFLIKRFTRIYIPLLTCLVVILCTHALLGKKVISQHTLLHLMGLSAFFELLLVPNKSTIGAGLWFITAINLMYLVFPLLQKLFRHPHGLVHLIIVVALCTMLDFAMYGTASIWNVVISFAVGVYIGVNGNTYRWIDAKTSLIFPLLGSLGLLVVAALSTAHVLPYAVRNCLFAFYPLALVPVLFAVSRRLPRRIAAASSLFASLSYEFYILHFYFINEGFRDFFPASVPMYGQMVIGFFATFVVALAISKVASWMRKTADNYLLERPIRMENSV